jgi:two-component sensor histidine kinase
LAQFARDFSMKKDFSLRAAKTNDDEIGFLTERFNEMLTQIQERDSALHQAHDEIKKHALDLQKELHEKQLTETRLKASLNEKEVLLKEIHHRVKNNLQIISSLLNLQTGHSKNEEASQIIQESQNRIRAMALIHETLYQSRDLAKIDFAEYIHNLAYHLFISYNVSSVVIHLNVEVDDVFLSINTAIPCGLIINELVSNSLKYAFPRSLAENRKNVRNEISIALNKEADEMLVLIISDNGVGLSPHIDYKNTTTLGLQLVNTLTEQLDGIIELQQQQGTTFKIVFPN